MVALGITQILLSVGFSCWRLHANPFELKSEEKAATRDQAALLSVQDRNDAAFTFRQGYHSNRDQSKSSRSKPALKRRQRTAADMSLSTTPRGGVLSTFKIGSIMGGRTDVNEGRNYSNRAVKHPKQSPLTRPSRANRRGKKGPLSSGDILSDNLHDHNIQYNETSIHEASSDAEETSSLIEDKR